jgi:CrcB protein
MVWRRPDAVLGAVAVGGALGAAARYGLGRAFPDPTLGFPWTTFAINVAGCLAIGVLAGLLGGKQITHPLIRPLLGTGFLGGFTTMSTYADQVRALLVADTWALAGAYFGGTLAAALLATWLGLAVVKRWRR